MLCPRELATINLGTKFQISTFTHYKDMKGDKNAKIWVLWGLGSPRVISNKSFDRVHTTFYSTLIETVHLSCTVFEL